MVERYIQMGYIKSPSIKEAMKNVPRELFMPKNLLQYAYFDEPYPIPGDGRQTISAPYTYPLFYEPLELRRGDKLLEVGMGSGYGAALAHEVVGEKGLVVTVEINEVNIQVRSKEPPRSRIQENYHNKRRWIQRIPAIITVR